MIKNFASGGVIHNVTSKRGAGRGRSMSKRYKHRIFAKARQLCGSTIVFRVYINIMLCVKRHSSYTKFYKWPNSKLIHGLVDSQFLWRKLFMSDGFSVTQALYFIIERQKDTNTAFLLKRDSFAGRKTNQTHQFFGACLRQKKSKNRRRLSLDCPTSMQFGS